MAKVYVFMADGCEEIEALTPVDLLRRAGVEVRMVSVMGRKDVCGAHKIIFEADLLFEETDFSDGDVFMLPGGMPGTTNLAAYQPLMELLREKGKEGKRLAAICAAPAVILGMNGFLQGKKAVCYPGMEDKLLGAEVQKAAVVTDGNITSSRGMGTAIAYGLEIIRLLQGEEAAAKMKTSVVYGHGRQD